MNYRVETDRDIARMRERLYLVAHDKFGRKSYLGFLDFAEIDPMEAVAGPTADLDEGELDALLASFAEKAWERGWRPKDFGAADTTAQQKHLEDMRRLVSAQLGVDLP